MATMDIFEGDAFSIIELTRALENIPFKPAILSGAGLFGSRGVRQRTVMIESRDGTLSLIPFSERGSAYEQQVPERRDMRAFVRKQMGCGATHAACRAGDQCDLATDAATESGESVHACLVSAMFQ